MEYLDQNLPEKNASGEGNLQTTRPMRQSWYAISQWSMFFAIAGFVMLFLGLFFVIRLSSMLPMMAYAMGENPVLEAISSMGAGFIALIGIGLAIQFLITYWLFRFAGQLKRAVTSTDQESFEMSWMNLRNVFRATGILAALGLLFTLGILSFVFAMTR